MEKDSILSNSSSTNCPHDPDSRLGGNIDPVFMTYYFGIFILLMLVNLTGNTVVLCTLRQHRSMWTPINGFICSLAMSDLMIGIIYPIYNVAGIDVASVTRVLGHVTICRILQTESLALELCSSYALVAITITRYVSITCPLRYHHYVTSRRSLVIVVVLWIVSHFACIILYWFVVPVNHFCNICRFEILFTVKQLLVLTSVQSIIPLAIMMVVYLRMALIARRVARQVGVENVAVETSTMHCRPPTSYRRQRSFVIITLLLGCFIVGWTPIIVYLFLIFVGHHNRTDYKYFGATSRIMLYMNSAVNVFIYAGRMGDFREYVRKDLHRLLPWCTTSRHTSRTSDVMISATVVGMTTRQNAF